MAEVRNDSRARALWVEQRAAWKRALRVMRTTFTHASFVRVLGALEPSDPELAPDEPAPARTLHVTLSEPAQNARGPCVFISFSHDDPDALERIKKLPIVVPWR